MMENEVEAEIDAVDDVEQKEVTPQDQINDMIAAAIKGDYVNANNHFNDILGDTKAQRERKVRQVRRARQVRKAQREHKVQRVRKAFKVLQVQ